MKDKTISEYRIRMKYELHAEDPEHTEEIEGTRVEVYKISDRHGYEYTLYNSDRNIEYNSFYESSNYIGDGARSLEEGIKWARRTLEEWD